MNKALIVFITGLIFIACSKDPIVTFINQTSSTREGVTVFFQGQAQILRTGGDQITFTIKRPGNYTFQSTASSADGFIEIDESARGTLILKENSQILVSYHQAIASGADSASGKIYKLWAAITDQSSGNPVAATSTKTP